MADNTTLNTMTGGDVIRDVNRSGVKTQVVALDAGDGLTEALVGPQNTLPVHDTAFDTAQSGEDPLGTFITGDPNGPYAGMDLLGEVIAGNAAFSTNPLLKKDAQNALILSDNVIFYGYTAIATTPPIPLVDTTGYQSVNVFCGGGSGTVAIQFSEDGKNWFAGVASNQGGSYVSTSPSFNASNVAQLVAPVSARYCRVNFATVTVGSPFAVLRLRNIPVSTVGPGLSVLAQLVNASGTPYGAEDNSISNATVITVGGVVRTALVSNTLVDADACRPTFSDSAGLVVEPHAIPQLTWNYAAAAAGILNTTTAVTIKAAVAGQRGCLSSIQLQHEPLGAATEFVIRDGAAGTVMWRIKLPLTTAKDVTTVVFDPPLRQAAVNVLMEVATLTASITGAVYFNASGYLSN